MKTESLRELVEESLGTIKVNVKNDRFTISGSTKWFEFFSGLFNETTLTPVNGKSGDSVPKKVRRKRGLPAAEGNTSSATFPPSDVPFGKES